MPGQLLTLVSFRDPAVLPSLDEESALFLGEVGVKMSSLIVNNVPSVNSFDRVIRWIVMRSARRHNIASRSRRGGG